MKIVPIWFILVATEGSDIWSVWAMCDTREAVITQLKHCRKVSPEMTWIKHKAIRIT